MILSSGTPRLSVKGETELGLWNGLKQFMLDFSNMKEYEMCIRDSAYIDHNTLQTGFENADDHRYIQSVAKKHGIRFSRRCV